MTFLRRARLSDKELLKAIADEAFPLSEQKPIDMLLSQRYACFVADFGQQEIGGFAALIETDSVVLLDYLAVNSNRRGSGVGEKIMRELLQIYCDAKEFFLEIETLGEGKSPEENETRARRKNFYSKFGFKECGLKTDLNGNAMTVLSLRRLKQPESAYLKIYETTFQDMDSPRYKTAVTERFDPQD